MTPAVDTKPKNRRLNHRRRARTSVRIECRKGSYGLGANVAVSILDVSESGVCLVTAQEFPLKTEVEVVLGGYGIRVALKRIAVVRWQLKLADGQFCTGMEFQKRLAYRDLQNLTSPN
jgi:hypothetical protein